MISKNREIDLYWFSGTGNTLQIAETLEKTLETEGFTVNLKPMEKTNPSDVDLNKTLGLAFPVAEQGTYPLVWDFIRNLPSPSARRLSDSEVFMIDTMATYSGGVKGPIRKILIRKGFRTLGAKEIIMPSNLLIKKKQTTKIQRKNERGKLSAEQFARNLVSGRAKWRDIPFYSDFMSSFSRMEHSWNLLRRIFPMKVDDSLCTRCRLCETNCPTGSWSFDEKENRMVWTPTDCFYCLRCFSYCPVQAIRYGKQQYVQIRGVSSGEMNKMLK